jgi:uncharacterized cupredoxin-like copper-binding protein
MVHVTRRCAVLFAAGVLMVSTGCSSDGGIGVTEVDYSINVDEDTAPAGDVTFDIQNDAGQIHEFVVFKTDLAPDALPLNEDGDVDEEGEGVTLIDEVEDIAGGSSENLTVNLDAGSYVLICNLPGHYKLGMHTGFSVT